MIGKHEVVRSSACLKLSRYFLLKSSPFRFMQVHLYSHDIHFYHLLALRTLEKGLMIA